MITFGERVQSELMINAGKILRDRIVYYYMVRGLKWPNTDQAMAWAITEYAEAVELLFSKGDWIRNNPEDKEGFSKERFAEEIGDVIFMLLVACVNEEVNPFKALVDKMDKKLVEIRDSQTSEQM